MTTETTTPATFTLWRLSQEYPRSYRGLGLSGIESEPQDSDAHVFFGTPDPDRSEDYVTLVLPDDDPRSAGMWAASDLRYVPQDGKTYRRWNVERKYVTPEESSSTPQPEQPRTPEDLRPGDWFTWGARLVWFRVARVDGENVHTDRRLYSETPTETPTTADAGQEFPDVWSKGSVRDGLHVLPPFDQETPQEPPQDAQEPVSSAPQESPEDAYARGKREAEEAASRKFEEWKARATEIAHTYANDNDLCSQFDRCMEDIGLPTRNRSVRVFVTVRDAMEIPRGGDVREYLIDHYDNDLRRFLSGLVTDGRIEDADSEDEIGSW